MGEGNTPSANIDLAALHLLIDRVVASNLTTAIYTRLHTRQSEVDYNEDDFDAVARDVVREVMQTYSALLNVFQGAHEEPADPENDR